MLANVDLGKFANVAILKTNQETSMNYVKNNYQSGVVVVDLP